MLAILKRARNPCTCLAVNPTNFVSELGYNYFPKEFRSIDDAEPNFLRLPAAVYIDIRDYHFCLYELFSSFLL